MMNNESDNHIRDILNDIPERLMHVSEQIGRRNGANRPPLVGRPELGRERRWVTQCHRITLKEVILPKIWVKRLED